uniref:Endoglucanase n=1 Tax=Saccoglossus kowalevskii TaxID=10224 RepID=A0ABM0MQ64_SACKO|nr:PREDICTED: uncharacterized protein LOC102805135 [Saccoglossus kowalevskii]
MLVIYATQRTVSKYMYEDCPLARQAAGAICFNGHANKYTGTNIPMQKCLKTPTTALFDPGVYNITWESLSDLRKDDLLALELKRQKKGASSTVGCIVSMKPHNYSVSQYIKSREVSDNVKTDAVNEELTPFVLEGYVSLNENSEEIPIKVDKGNSDCQRKYVKGQKKINYWYDRNARLRDFKPGDKVLVLFPMSGHALQARYHGPYVIESKLSDLNYFVKTPNSWFCESLCTGVIIEERNRQNELQNNDTREYHSGKTTFMSAFGSFKSKKIAIGAGVAIAGVVTIVALGLGLGLDAGNESVNINGTTNAIRHCPCEQVCAMRGNNYTCSCKDGYGLDNDGIHCLENTFNTNKTHTTMQRTLISHTQQPSVITTETTQYRNTAHQTDMHKTTLSQPWLTTPQTGKPSTIMSQTPFSSISIHQTDMTKTTMPRRTNPRSTIPQIFQSSTMTKTTLTNIPLHRTDMPETTMPKLTSPWFTTQPSTIMPQTSLPSITIQQTSMAETTTPKISHTWLTTPMTTHPSTFTPLTSPTSMHVQQTDIAETTMPKTTNLQTAWSTLQTTQPSLTALSTEQASSTSRTPLTRITEQNKEPNTSSTPIQLTMTTWPNTLVPQTQPGTNPSEAASTILRTTPKSITKDGTSLLTGSNERSSAYSTSILPQTTTFWTFFSRITTPDTSTPYGTKISSTGLYETTEGVTESVTTDELDLTTVATCPCEHMCDRIDDNWVCSCRSGYELTENLVNCTDVDECATGNATCEQNCTNTVGSYYCYCQEGMIVQDDNSSCNYDYDEVLRKSLLFYEAQRSGVLPDNNRIPWRGDSAVNDSTPDGKDLSGGYYDGKVGSVNGDHGYWGRAEDMTMDRPAYKVDEDNPGSDVVGGTAAAMAAIAFVFKDRDANYSATLVDHARELFTFADDFREKYSVSIPMAAKVYDSTGYMDEIIWAACWLYKATNEISYLDRAILLFNGESFLKPYAFGWNDVTVGYRAMLLQLTQNTDRHDASFKLGVTAKFLTEWLPGGSMPYTPKGLVFRDNWGSLRYATASAFIALTTAEAGVKTTAYRNWAKSQVDYVLGYTGRSFVVGYGVNPPVQPHHRGSSCPDEPAPCGAGYLGLAAPNPQVLYGAMVGGPGANDNYKDSRKDYFKNEVSLDFNAGFQSVVAEIS